MVGIPQAISEDLNRTKNIDGYTNIISNRKGSQLKLVKKVAVTFKLS